MGEGGGETNQFDGSMVESVKKQALIGFPIPSIVADSFASNSGGISSGIGGAPVVLI